MQAQCKLPGYVNCYITAEGKVFNGGKEKTPIQKKGAAPQIRLQENNRTLTYGLATLIAKAFVPNPQGFTKVVFLDGNNRNCQASNLNWVSNQEFSRYSMHKGLPAILPPKPVKVKKERPTKVKATKERREVPVPNDGRQLIPGTMGYYITPKGEVFNRAGFPLKHITAPNRGAWVKVKDKNGERIKTTIAKLVALTFIPNPDWHGRVIFRDRNKCNASVENLMWVSEWEYRSWYRNTGCDLLGEAGRPKPNLVERHPFSMPVRDFPGYYIAPDGTVYKGARIVKPQTPKGKSLKVLLRDKETGLRFTLGLGKLVARHFVPNPRNHKYIIFKDRDRRNCHRDNIAWVDGETFMWYSGLLQNPGRKRKVVLTREEALQRCTHALLRRYYESSDESWLTDIWNDINTKLSARTDWKEYQSDCYLYFTDRARRFSILSNPQWLMLWYLKILRLQKWKEISPAMPLATVRTTDESLRNIGEWE